MVAPQGRRTSFFIAAAILVALDLILTQAIHAAEAKDSQQGQLKSAVQDYAQKIAPLEAWQTKIYDEEVVPQYQRFIRDYRPSGSGLTVEIDQVSVKRYLQFYAPKLLRARDYRFIVLIKVDPTCEKCQASASEILAVAQARLGRRGLTPQVIRSEDLADPRMAGKALEDLGTEMARQKQAAGVLVIQSQNAPQDDEDAGHADEKRYQLRTFVQVREMSGVKHQGQMELLANDAFEPAIGRLLTDAWTEIGGKVESMANASLTGGEGGVLLEVSGFKDYAMFQEIRTKLLAGLKDVASLDERRVQRGRVWLLAVTSRSAEDVRRQLLGLGLRGQVEVKQ